MKKILQNSPLFTLILLFLLTIFPSITFAAVSGESLLSDVIASDNAGLTPQNSGDFGVNEFTGAFGFSYPIAVPPGRNQLQPDLLLQYNHQLQNAGDMAGYGWQLNIPYIQRDDRFGTDEIYEHNNFQLSLNGFSDLVPVSVDGGGYGSYGKKVENDFSKIEFIPGNKWLVTDKLGTVYTFGSTVSTRQDNPLDSSQIYKWMLEEVRDLNDNFIRYEYYKDSGQIYPKKIFYTGHGSIDGIFEVGFQPFASESPIENNSLTTSYRSGFQVKTRFLLNSVDIKINGELKTSHKLNFAAGQSKYLLSSIVPEFYEGAVPYTKDQIDFEYSYEQTSYSLADEGYYVLPANLDDTVGLGIKGDVFLDLNGDSLTDYIRLNCTAEGNVSINPSLNNGVDGWGGSGGYAASFTAPHNCNILYGVYHTMPVAFANLNGDNLIDMVTGSTFYINTGSGWSTAASNLPVGLHYTSSGGSSPVNQVIFRDMNADGYDDIIYNHHPNNVTAKVDVYIRDEFSGGWNLDSDYSITATADYGDCFVYGGDPFGYADLNSDGLSDIFYKFNCSYYSPPSREEGAYLNTGGGLVQSTDYAAPITPSNFTGSATARQSIHYFSDFNQDGVSESANYLRQRWTTVSGHWASGGLSLFGQVFDTGAINGSSYFDNGLPVAIADVNGDQIQDVIHDYAGTYDLYLGRSVKPDVLNQINYQSGAKTYIEYGYSSQEKNEFGNLENPELPFSLYVVKEVVVDNSDQQWQGTRYFYKDGKTLSYLNDGIRDVFGFSEVEKHTGIAMPDIDFGDGSDGAFVSSGNITWTTDKNFTSLTIQPGHTITVEPQVVIKVQGDVVINGILSAKGQGYPGGAGNGSNPKSGAGPGGGENGTVANAYQSTGAGGAGHAQVGENGYGCNQDFCRGGAVYSNELLENIDKGSGGGGALTKYQDTGFDASGGDGGGIVQIFAKSITVNGEIDADGNKGDDGKGFEYSAGGGAGGGSGGSIFIKVFGSADLGANSVHALGGVGGTGMNGYDGGDGAIGRIRIEASQVSGTTNPTYFRNSEYYYSIQNVPQDDSLKKASDFYHVAADSGFYLHGQLKQSTIRDSQDVLVSTSFQELQEVDLGNQRKFVSLANTSDTDLTGNQVTTATRYTYDTSNGNILTEKKLGEVVINIATGQITNELLGDEKTTSYQYASNPAKHILAIPMSETLSSALESRQKNYYYDNLAHGQISYGNLTTEDFILDGIEIDRTYNPLGLLITQTDANGNISSLTYDAFSLYPAESTNALSQTTLTSFNLLNGEVAISATPNGFVTQNIFDAYGRLIETKISDPNTPAQLITNQTTIYQDIVSPRYKQTTNYLDTSNSVVSREYKNSLDQLIQTKAEMEGGNYATVDFTYDLFGRVVRESLPYFTPTVAYTSVDLSKPTKTYTYDIFDRVLSEATSVGTTAYQYSGLKTTLTDPNGNNKDLTKDAYGNLAEVKEYNGAAIYTTSYDYNTFDELTKISDALGNVRNFTYDDLGRRISAEDLHAPGDTIFGTWIYNYDKNGNLATSTDPKSQAISYSYDALNRIEAEDYVGQEGAEVSYSYDSCTNGIGHLCNASSTDAVIDYVYDVRGLVTSETATIDSETFTTAYNYDLQNNLTLLTYPDNSQVQYQYNTAGLLETVAQSNDGVVFSNIIENFDYNPQGQVTYQQNSNGTETTNVYDAEQLYRLTNKTTISPSMEMAMAMSQGGEFESEPLQFQAAASQDSVEVSAAVASASWTLVGSTTLSIPGAGSAQDITLPGTPEQGDVVIVAGVANSAPSQGMLVNTSGYISLYSDSSRKVNNLLEYKVLGATPDSMINVSPSDSSGDDSSFVVQVWRGADGATPLDGLLVSASGGKKDPDSPAYTAQTDNALVFSVGFLDDDNVSNSPSLSGYSNIVTKDSEFGSGGSSVMMASKEVTTAGPEDPPAWDTTGDDSWKAVTFALRLSADGGGDPPTGTDPGYALTNKATSVQEEQAILNGFVDLQNATSTNAFFTYGTSNPWGATSTAQILTSSSNFNSAVTGLSPLTTYYFRASAISGLDGSQSFGNTYVFTTGSVTDSTQTQSDWSTGTLSQVVASASGSLELVSSGGAPASWTLVGLTTLSIPGAGSAQDITLPGTPEQGDVVIVAGVANSAPSQGMLVNTSGYTSLYSDSSRKVNNLLEYKVLGATPDSMINVSSSDSSGDDSNFVIQVWRGADPTTPIDATLISASGGKKNPDSPAYTAQTDNALVFSVGFLDDDNVSNSPSLSGYSNIVTKDSEFGSGGSSVMMASKEVTTAGPEDPPAWDTTGDDSWKAVTFALRQNAGVSASYDEGYRVSPAINVGPVTNADSSNISWFATLNDPANEVYVLTAVSDSLPADSDYATSTNGGPIAGITTGDNLSGKNLYVKVKLVSGTGDSTPSVDWIALGVTNIPAPSIGASQNLTYSYDAVGNILQIIDASENNGAKIVTYTYDDLNRLASATSAGAVSGSDFARTFTYDAIGNLLNKSDQGAYSYEGNQGTSYANPHAATSINGNAYSYDENGNLISDSASSYTWDYNNRLAQAVSAGKTSIYGYDHTGQRVKLDNGTSIAVYPNKYYNKKGTIQTKHIFAEDQLVATIEDTTTRMIHTDHLGGTHVVSDESGIQAELNDYYPFGELRLDEGSFDEQRKFTGHEYDKDTDLTYMGARYYTGNAGKFISQDPAYLAVGSDNLLKSKVNLDREEYLANPQFANSYSYTINNPLKFQDKNGEFVFIPIALGAWAVAEVALSAYDIYDAAQTVSDPTASLGEKGLSVGFAALGVIGPGGGYGAGAKALNKTGGEFKTLYHGTGHAFTEIGKEGFKTGKLWLTDSRALAGYYADGWRGSNLDKGVKSVQLPVKIYDDLVKSGGLKIDNRSIDIDPFWSKTSANAFKAAPGKAIDTINKYIE